MGAHPRVQLHFQVELWFGKIERDVIARGVISWYRPPGDALLCSWCMNGLVNEVAVSRNRNSII